MALLNPYCTVAQLQKEIRNDDSSLTAELEQAINAASRHIDRYKGRDYFFHDHSAAPGLKVWPSMNACFGLYLHLPYWPIITITEVKVGAVVWVENVDWVRVENQPWQIVAINGEEWATAWDTTDVLSIRGTFGYTQATSAAVPSGLPEYINQACILTAAALSGHNQKEVIGLDGQKQQITSKDIPKTAKDLLGSGKILI